MEAGKQAAKGDLFEIFCLDDNEVLYKCSSCETTFHSEEVDDHLKQFHQETSEDIQDDGSGECESDEDMAFVIKNEAGKYECMVCSKSYKSLKRFIDHVKMHGDVPKRKIEKLEEILNEVKKDKETVCEEITIGNETNFRCTICNTVFTTRKKLMLHVSIHRNVAEAVEKGNELESKGDLYHCKLCNRSLRNEYDMELHMKAHEENNTNGLGSTVSEPTAKRVRIEGEKPTYPCQFCQKEFKRPHEKVKHERVHTGEKPYSCDICGKQFRVTYCLSLHKRNVHSDERPYICTFEGCNKRFKSQSVYNHHLNTHGTEKNFKCPYCSKAFKTSVQLAGHKNTHTKPFACQVCSRAFASLYAVRIHMEVHRNEETSLKYTCKICLAQYGRKFALADHIKADHPTETGEIDDNMHYIIEELAVEEESEEVYSVVELSS